MTQDVMASVDAYLEAHRDDFEEQLKSLIRIPSVSAQPQHDADTRRAAELIRDDLSAMGLPAELIETKRHPLVYAEWLGAAGKPTLLIYGHYDVQPPEPLEPWLSPPFEPTVRDGNLYARGATDDKGQMFTHLKAAEAWLKTAGKLPVNVKFLIEGEEEVGGANLEEYVADHADRLACDYAVISDSSQLAPGMPAITYGLKGLAYFELLVQGANRDLHSGTYGGAVANPINALCEILATLKGPDGRDPDRRLLRSCQAARGLGAGGVRQAAVFRGGVPERPRRTRLDGRGRLFHAGAEVGASDVRHQRDLRRVRRSGTEDGVAVQGGGQVQLSAGPRSGSPGRSSEQLRDHLARVCPPGVTYELLTHHGAPAVLVDVDTPGVRAAMRAVETGFGTRPVFIREGGSIPVVGLIKQQLGVDTLLLGWGQNDDNLHGPNEKFSLADFHRGIKSSAHLFDELARETVS